MLNRKFWGKVTLTDKNEAKTTDVITEYVKTLLLQVEQKIKSNDFLASYKG